MKKYNFLKASLTLAVVLAFSTDSQAQLKANQTIANASINNSTAFLDASSSTVWNPSTTLGKGFLFPRADLTQLVLTNNGSYLTANNPNRFDGLIVYNTGSGNTPASGSGIGGQSVAPGFYYFSNPGSPTGTATGQWLPLGQSPRVDIKTTETITNTLVDGAQVYARKGTFTTDGASTSPISYSSAITIPDTATDGIYRVTIYAPGTNSVYATTVYSFNPTTGALVTGSPSISVVYPAGTYPYTVEYFK
ncbi:hypothetical protein [Chryseobacterium daecheongense]|uniref:Uncharacterized protein n=1 Tax=Chryseobacterium daecheongense TaxID=192389 RepID=A0A3N0W628_9FLAO|nr:hypothetical protein [Chryseobacterium daecheongense]ROI00514.1 hypothetical protein EGI05_06420 [Chryseobacterium daecheongense]TDX94510.1 hypothetical protein BCF50_0278 [Chryseobacterium daecheongense]